MNESSDRLSNVELTGSRIASENIAENEVNRGTGNEFPSIQPPWTESEEISRDLRALPAAELFKRATSARRAGDLAVAINIERAAIERAESEEMDFGVDRYARLPVLLQEAGRSDEAVLVFEWLLGRGHTTGRNPETLEPMMFSNVFDKMRLFWQREDRSDVALAYGLLSLLAWGKGLALQGRTDELKRHKEICADSVTKLSRKVKGPGSNATIEDVERSFWQDIEKVSTLRLAECRKRYLQLNSNTTQS